MTLILDYNIFEGIELLEYSIKELRDEVDYINVTYQNKSYWGHPIKSKDFDKLLELKNIGLIDSLTPFRFDEIAKDVMEAKELEKKKRNESKNLCLSKGFTHYLSLDGDEFFKKEEFRKTKQYIIDNKIDFSACYYYNYYNFPIYRSKKINSSIIPFICRLDKTKLEGAQFLGRCDPTRSYNIDKEILLKTILFKPEDLMMHHFTNVRSDLYRKYDSTSMAGLDRNRINEIIRIIKSIYKNNLKIETDIKNLGNDSFEIVDNFFNIPLQLFI